MGTYVDYTATKCSCTSSLGDYDETPVHVANQDLQNKMLHFPSKRNNILMIHAIGIILPEWTMIYVFHVRTGFLRG